MNWLRDIRNRIDFPLRQRIAWERTGLGFKQESKHALFDYLPEDGRKQAKEREVLLRSAYHLDNFYNNSTCQQYREALYYLDLLEAAIDAAAPTLPDTLTMADIGVSHWFYVQTLHALLKWWHCPDGRQLKLHGFECDPYRVYANLHSRFDYAIAHIGKLADVDFHPYAFSKHPPTFNLVLMLFPFVFQHDHLQWGLPGNYFNPQDLLLAAWQSLQSGGLLITVNQGAEEHQAQLKLLSHLPNPTAASFEFTSPFFEYELPRFVTVVIDD